MATLRGLLARGYCNVLIVCVLPHWLRWEARIECEGHRIESPINVVKHNTELVKDWFSPRSGGVRLARYFSAGYRNGRTAPSRSATAASPRIFEDACAFGRA